MDEEFYIPSKTVVGDDIYSINQKTFHKKILHIIAIINTKASKKRYYLLRKFFRVIFILLTAC